MGSGSAVEDCGMGKWDGFSTALVRNAEVNRNDYRIVPSQNYRTRGISARNSVSLSTL